MSTISRTTLKIFAVVAKKTDEKRQSERQREKERERKASHHYEPGKVGEGQAEGVALRTASNEFFSGDTSPSSCVSGHSALRTCL